MQKRSVHEKAYYICLPRLRVLFQSSIGRRRIVKDNSFLIEEAYNQEAGVVQFVFAHQYVDPSQDATTTFTNEIPMGGETHQFSYVIPMQKVGITEASGIGDILVNYRYQMVNNEHVAMAPRLSLILPTIGHHVRTCSANLLVTVWKQQSDRTQKQQRRLIILYREFARRLILEKQKWCQGLVRCWV
ncbi:hypothetical protein D3C87_1200780 [compost metagenome]